jgi:hypothetical protein
MVKSPAIARKRQKEIKKIKKKNLPTDRWIRARAEYCSREGLPQKKKSGKEE